MNKKFEWFLKKFGEPKEYDGVSFETTEAYMQKLPDTLLQCWKEYGFCSFKNGLFFLVNPAEYNDIVKTWLKGTGLLELDTFHVFARSGFGELFLWGERTGQHFNIEILDSLIFDNGSNENYINKNGSDEALLNFFTVLKPSSLDIDDVDTDEPIFEQAIAKFGPLNSHEMFTFEPAPFLGGKKSLKVVNKVNFFVQCEVLAGMGQREIMDLEGLTRKAFS